MPLTSQPPTAALVHGATARIDINVDGAALGGSSGMAVLRAEVRHELGRPASVVVETADLDAGELEWIDDGTVQEGRPLVVSMFLDEMGGVVFAGDVTGVDLDVTTDHLPRIAVRGYDRLHRLARARKTRAFVDQRDSQIAAAIAQEHGLAAAGPASPLVHPYVMQREQTDLAFLLARARGLGYVLRVEGTELRFGPRGLDDGPALTAVLGKNLLELRVSTSVLGQVGRVAARGWDPARQAALVAEVAESALASKMGGATSGPALADAGFKAETTAALGVAVTTARAAELAAAAELEARALDHVSCRGRLLGTAGLRPGAILEVAGFGLRFSGRYWLTRVVHCFDRDGFTTEFEARRTAT